MEINDHWQLIELNFYLILLAGDTSAMIALQPALKFNGGGFINHAIFWTNLSPNGGGEPTGIMECISATIVL